MPLPDKSTSLSLRGPGWRTSTEFSFWIVRADKFWAVSCFAPASLSSILDAVKFVPKTKRQTKPSNVQMAAQNSLSVSKWVGMRFSANHRFATIRTRRARITTCTLAEGPYVYFGQRPPTLCGLDHLFLLYICRPIGHHRLIMIITRNKYCVTMHFQETHGCFFRTQLLPAGRPCLRKESESK